MKKIVKNIFAIAFFVAITSSFGVLQVQAATQYTDTESNNSADEAQTITTNAMTYSQKVSGSTSLYRYVTGSLSDGNDEDWYKAYLYSNRDNYFTISRGTGTTFIDILDANQNVIYSFSYNGLSSSENVFRVDVAETEIYYIRLYHNINVTSNYKFVIGNPEYLLDSYTHAFGSQTLPARGSWERTVDLAMVSSIPNQAIGYKITVSGCTTSVCSERLFCNDFYGDWVATRTGYAYNLPVTESSALAQIWGIRYESTNTSNKTFTPEFTINYVYPDLPANEQ